LLIQKKLRICCKLLKEECSSKGEEKKIYISDSFIRLTAESESHGFLLGKIL